MRAQIFLSANFKSANLSMLIHKYSVKINKLEL